MNKATEIRRWFAGCLSHRIDQQWFGGALAVAVLAWLVFGVQYIALFLIGFYYIFSACMRKKIWARYTKYYAARYAYLASYVESDADKNKTNHLKVKLIRGLHIGAIIVSATALIRGMLWLLEYKGFSAGTFSVWLTNSIFCFGFLVKSLIFVMRHDHLLPEEAVKIFDAEGKFRHLLPEGHLPPEELLKTFNAEGKYRKSGNKKIYKSMCTALFFTLWGATFYWYQQGLIGGDTFFGSRGREEAFCGVFFINWVVWLFASLSIHFSFHLSEKSS